MARRKKYKLRLTKLDFISAVDTPAQETANALLFKRGRGRPAEIEHDGIVATAHKSSDELGLVFCWAFTSKIAGAEYYDLQGDTIDEDSIVEVAADFMESSRAVDEMHDGVGKGTTVFAMPWTSEIAKAFLGVDAEPGTTGLMVAIKPPPEIFEKFKSGEYTGVSIGGAGMRAEIDDAADKRNAEKAHGVECDLDEDCTCGVVQWSSDSTATAPVEYSKRGRLTSATDGHTHLVDDEVIGGAGHTSYEHSNGDDGGHAHPFAIDDDGAITIGESQGHTHEVAQAVEARAPEDQLQRDEPAETTNQEQDDMNEIETLKAQLARAEKLAELNDAEKAHLATLDSKEGDSFLALSKSERGAAIAKADEADTVVYTAADGTVYRKSHNAAIVAAIKSADEAHAKLAASEERERTAVLAKRAADELAHLPGDEVAKVAALRAIDGIEDEGARKAAHAMLIAADNAQAQAFKSLGTIAQSEANEGAAMSKLNALAKSYAEANKVTHAIAFAEVCKTAEGRALYTEHRNSTEQARS